MWAKFEKRAFGTCPRYFCNDQPLLPLGPSALPGVEAVRVYCLCCQDLYVPSTLKHAKMDGVPFGPTFAHFFTRTVMFTNAETAVKVRKECPIGNPYVPKIYGFRVFREGHEPFKRPEAFDYK